AILLAGLLALFSAIGSPHYVQSEHTHASRIVGKVDCLRNLVNRTFRGKHGFFAGKHQEVALFSGTNASAHITALRPPFQPSLEPAILPSRRETLTARWPGRAVPFQEHHESRRFRAMWRSRGRLAGPRPAPARAWPRPGPRAHAPEPDQPI